MAQANSYDPSDLTTTTNYIVTTTGDRFFIPFNSDAASADQLAQCQTLSPNGVEEVAT